MTCAATFGNGATISARWIITRSRRRRIPGARRRVKPRWFAAAPGDSAPKAAAPAIAITRVRAIRTYASATTSTASAACNRVLEQNEKRRAPTQDGHPFRRFVRPWDVERMFAWLFNFRPLVTHSKRYESKI